jgi:hypothetical protein
MMVVISGVEGRCSKHSRMGPVGDTGPLAEENNDQVFLVISTDLALVLTVKTLHCLGEQLFSFDLRFRSHILCI